jgi:GNAT superfamily N-acetyltransferase
MSSHPLIRPAGREDVPAIVALLADDPIGATRERIEDPLPAAYYDAFAAIDSDPNQELLVADAGGTIVGTLQLTYTPGLSRLGSWRATVEAVRVSAAARGGGIGKQMLQDAAARARAHGCRLLQLTTDKRRDDARRFYEGLGFRATHEGMKLLLDES